MSDVTPPTGPLGLSSDVAPPTQTPITRSSAAFTSAAAGRVSRQRMAQPNGWWGMALFLCAEATLFGSLIATYFYLDFDAHTWPPVGVERPSVTGPFVATGVLVATVLPMLGAVLAARNGRRARVAMMIALGLAVQCGYLAYQIVAFRSDLLHFTPRATAYGSIYFTLLGAHHAHVLVGILLDIGVLWQVSVRGLSNYWLIGVRVLALYWYVVAALAVLVVFTQVSPSL
jgi:heme/copper-type cytochrome/quinol oxidase subunit 3